MVQIRAEMNQLWAIGGPRHQAKVERHLVPSARLNSVWLHSRSTRSSLPFGALTSSAQQLPEGLT